MCVFYRVEIILGYLEFIPEEPAEIVNPEHLHKISTLKVL